MFIAALCSVGTGFSVPWNVIMFGNLVGAMIDIEIVSALKLAGLDVTGYIVTDVMEAVTTFAIGTVVIGSVIFTLTYVSITLFNYTSNKQIFRVRTMYFRSILHQDISWYDVINSGDIASRLNE